MCGRLLLFVWFLGLNPAVALADSAAAGTAPALTAEDVSAFLDGTMATALATADMPGAVIVVVKDGDILSARAYGYADVAARLAADPQQTLFRIASISKLFTWTAVMQQVEQGRLDLDRDVNAYLDFEIPDTFAAPITLRHMMTHTSGFEDTQKGMIRNAPGQLEPLGQALRENLPARIFEPGRIVAYSNYAAALAGYIVERVTGEPFDRYAERHIFQPLGMHDTTFSQPLPERLVGRLARAYYTASGSPRPLDYLQPWPCGSAVSSGTDLARFMSAHLQGGEYRGARILQPQSVAAMQRRAIDIAPGEDLNSWTLGFWEERRNGRRAIGHGGNLSSFHSYLDLLPDERIGLFMIFNGSGTANHYDLRFALYRGFMDRYFPQAVQPALAPLSSALDHRQEIAGSYVGSRRTQSGFMQVASLFEQARADAHADGTLTFTALRNLGGSVIRWREVAPYRWRGVNSDASLVAVRDEAGAVAYLVTDQMPPTSVFQRVPWWQSKRWNLPFLIATAATLLVAVIASTVLAMRAGLRRPGQPHARDTIARHALVAATCVLNLV
jgi:CubicO group peptidase (beta-lactamase class C family)